MRKQNFARLELEPLEKLVLPNMLWTVSPFSFFNEATSEPPSSLGPQTPMASIRRTSTISMLLDSSQTRDGLSSVSSAVNAPSNSQTSISTFTTQNTIFFSASDDLSDPLSSDFFGIDLLVASKGGAPSFMGRNSLGPSDAGGNPSSAAADRTGQNTPPANAGAFAGIITSTSGPISLLSNLGSSANLLLPATTSAPAALSASHNGGPVSPLGGPSFGSGPNTGIGLLVLDSPQFVPVNADNDNGSGFALDSHGNTASGIPQKRDFNVAPMINAQTQQLVNDPELIWGSI